MGAVGTAVETSTARPLTGGIVSTPGTLKWVMFDALPGFAQVPSPVSLGIVDPEQDRAPCTLTVSVSGVWPYATVTFSIDGDTIWTADADDDGNIEDVTIDIPADLAAGDHILTAFAGDNGSDTAEFTLLFDPLPQPLDSLDDEAEAVPDSDGKWVFQDLAPGGLGSWVLPNGPSTMTPPHFERSIAVKHTTSTSHGQFVATEGAFLGKPWRVQGTYLTEDFYKQLLLYAGLNRRFYVIDHRGRAWKVGIVALTTEPRRVPDWIGGYVIDFIIYDQAPSTPS